MAKTTRGRGRGSPQELREAIGAVDEAVLSEVEGIGSGRVAEMAEAALAEFDYERALALFKAAVLKSEGGTEAVCRLATFLVDDYAQFDEAVRLLQSPACDVDLGGKRLLARSLFMLERREEALAAYLEVNEGGAGDALSWKRQGLLQRDLGATGEAIAAFQKALALDPADGDAARAKVECEQRLGEEVSGRLSEVMVLIDAGAVDKAEGILAGMDSGTWLPPEYYRVKNRLAKEKREAEKAGLVERAREREVAGDLDGALRFVRLALSTDSEDASLGEWVERLDAGVRRQAATEHRQRGNDAFARGELSEAILQFAAAWVKDRTLQVDSPGATALAGLVADYMEGTGRPPGAAQVASLEALCRAVVAEESGDAESAILFAGRAGALMEQHPAGVRLRERLAQRRRQLEAVAAQSAFERGEKLEREGRGEEAADQFELAAAVAGFDLGEQAGARAQALRRAIAQRQAAESLVQRVTELLGSQEYFQALRELSAAGGGHESSAPPTSKGPGPASSEAVTRGDDPSASALRAERTAALADLFSRARAGVAEKYPLVVNALPLPGLEPRSEYRSGKDGISGFTAGASLAINTSPDSGAVFILSGRSLLCLDVQELRAVGTAELPPAAELAGKNGFVLYDLLPGDRNALLFFNFDDDYLLQIEHRRGRMEVANVMPLARSLRTTRQQVRRWFVPAGREEKLLVCQSAPGAGGGTAFYGISLHDGRLLHEEEFGYTLTNLRRLPGREGEYLVHRHPEPSQMRRPGYFSFALVDSRMRVLERFHVPPQELDGSFIESCRWLRFGKSGWYALARCFDMYSGQLIRRPLAFLAMGKDKRLRYAAVDSSQLLQKSADLEPLGELIAGPSGEDWWVVSGRRGPVQTLFVIDLDSFKVVRKTTVPEGEAVVAIAAGSKPGEYVTVSLVGEAGEVVVRRSSGR